MLLDEFNALGIQFEQATWDDRKNTEGKPEKRRLKLSDIEVLHPFHWGYEFDKVMADGGFDGIITNPPWETFQPNAKEFFAEYSDLVTKKKMDIKEFEQELKRLLREEPCFHEDRETALASLKAAKLTDRDVGLVCNREWLDKATRVISKYWQEKNRKEKERTLANSAS
jgi:hypothetical protein